jgi:hypothetical protein
VKYELATPVRPVKVINYLLAVYVEPAIPLAQLQRMKIFSTHPPPSIFWINPAQLRQLLAEIDLGFMP